MCGGIEGLGMCMCMTAFVCEGEQGRVSYIGGWMCINEVEKNESLKDSVF